MMGDRLTVAWFLCRWRLAGHTARLKAYRQYRALGWSRVDAVTKARRG